MSLIVPFFEDSLACLVNEKLNNLRGCCSPMMNSTKADGFLIYPPVDIHDEEKKFIIKTELPGVSKDQIKIDIEGNNLVIHGENKSEKTFDDKTWKIRERTFGKFERRIHLPKTVGHENIEAKYENGVLVVTLDKITKPLKSIEIK
jgi:HSP20 family protein